MHHRQRGRFPQQGSASSLPGEERARRKKKKGRGSEAAAETLDEFTLISFQRFICVAANMGLTSSASRLFCKAGRRLKPAREMEK
jgi:hypothetical protein